MHVNVIPERSGFPCSDLLRVYHITHYWLSYINSTSQDPKIFCDYMNNKLYWYYYHVLGETAKGKVNNLLKTQSLGMYIDRNSLCSDYTAKSPNLACPKFTKKAEARTIIAQQKI